MSDPKKIERAKRMLGSLEELAKRDPDSPEGLRAAAAAMKLREQYDLEDFKAGTLSADVLRQEFTLDRQAEWLRTLAAATAHFFDCALSYVPGTCTAYVWGDPTGAELTQFLITALCNQIETELKAWSTAMERRGARGLEDPYLFTNKGKLRAKVKDEFRRGAALSLIHRLQTMKDASAQGGSEVPSTLALSRQNRAMEAIKALPKRPAPAMSVNQAGIDAGMRIPIQSALGAGEVGQ